MNAKDTYSDDSQELLRVSLHQLQRQLLECGDRSVLSSQLSTIVDKCIDLSIQCFGRNIEETVKIWKYVLISYSKTTDDLENQRVRLDNKLNYLTDELDHKLKSLMEDYMIILENEMKLAKNRSLLEREEGKRMSQEAKIMRDIKIFSQDLSFHSQSLATFQLLERSSPQYIKCEKAFFENLNSNIQMFSQDLEVFNIAKLDNEYLSKLFQRSVTSCGDNSKVKGVFCLLPFDYYCHFASYGLFLQEINRASETDRKDISEWYVNPWHDTVTDPIQCSRMQPSELFIDMTSKSIDLLNFSNNSSSVNRDAWRDSNNNNVGCSVLCRVLINSSATMYLESLSNDEVAAARHKNIDVVYNTERNEYFFLNARHVLPEFFIFYKSIESVQHRKEYQQSISKLDYEKRICLNRKQEIISSLHEILKSSMSKLTDELSSEFAKDSEAKS